MSIDFGLSSGNASIEDKAVDLYVLERAWISTHPTTASVLAALWDTYFSCATNSKEIKIKLAAVRLRGRKRSMLG